jgi:hypothetical protein
MDEKIIEKLKLLAEKRCWSDDENFMVDDYAGGNEDDAYYGGVDTGEIWLAREILNMMNVQYTIVRE